MQICRATERGGTMTPGPMDFRGPIEMILRNQRVRSEDLFWGFFFGDHLISTGKTVRIFGEDLFFLEINKFRPEKPLKFRWRFFFFGDHIIIWTKLRHFLRLFWSSLNRKSVIFELAPGPRSALGAPANMAGCLPFHSWNLPFHSILESSIFHTEISVPFHSIPYHALTVVRENPKTNRNWINNKLCCHPFYL